MRAIIVLLVLTLLAPCVGAFHDACPATPANVTVRVLDGGVYVLGSAVYQETNGHAGLQQGALPDGCLADARVA